MRIVSLLPSATEVVYALGLGHDLVGVTSSCDFPAEARTKAVVSSAVLDDTGISAAELDRLVSERAASGGSMYDLDVEAIAALDPDVVLTQDLCAVCAVPVAQVDVALAGLGSRAEVVSLDPHTLDEVLDTVLQVGRATGAEDRAAHEVKALRARIDVVQDASRTLRHVPTYALEWVDPPFTAGHWVPEMIELAGGAALGAVRGARSARTTWADVTATEPEVVLVMPCGYGLDQATEAARTVAAVPGLGSARVVPLDADGLFSRPGPRLVEGLEVLAAALHPDVFPA